MSGFHVCPYCHAAYHYKDIIMLKGKNQECCHCHEKIRINRSLMFITIIMICAILVFADYVIIRNNDNMTVRSFLTMAASDAAVVLLSMLTAPVFIRLRKQ